MEAAKRRLPVELRKDSETEKDPKSRISVFTNEEGTPVRRVFGIDEPRGYGIGPRLSLETSAAFAVYVDPVRIRAALEGNTLAYVVQWEKEE